MDDLVCEALVLLALHFELLCLRLERAHTCHCLREMAAFSSSAQRLATDRRISRGLDCREDRLRSIRARHCFRKLVAVSSALSLRRLKLLLLKLGCTTIL